MKYQDMRDPKPGAGDVLFRVAGISINPEDMLGRDGDTKDRYRSAGCHFKTNDANVRRTFADPAALRIRQNLDVHSNYSKYGAVALCYRLRRYCESITRVTTRVPVLNSALASFLRTSTATAECMIDEGYTLRAKLLETVIEGTDAAGNRMFRSSKRKGI
jgi:hypothetical protein